MVGLTERHLKGSVCFVCGTVFKYDYGYPVVCTSCAESVGGIPIADHS